MRHYILVLTGILLITLTGCVDEVGYEPAYSPKDPTSRGTELTFTVRATPYDDDNNGSRAISYSDPTYYEDWIDTQDKFRVLFFICPNGQTTKNGCRYYGPDYFLFESKGRWVTQMAADASGHRAYQVTVPLYDVGTLDKEYSEDWGRIRDLLMKYQFKVAILANHPLEAAIDGAAANAPAWTYADSYLANERTPSKAKTINDLHHCSKDNTYDDISGSTDRYPAYDFMLGAPYQSGKGTHNTGPWIDWVIMRTDLYEDGWGETFRNREGARTWIRNHWRPALSVNEDYATNQNFPYHYRKYRHLWYVWNFGGAQQGSAAGYNTLSTTNQYMTEWEDRNGQKLRNWVTNGCSSSGKLAEDGQMNEFRLDGTATAYTTTSGGQSYYGVRLASTAYFTFKQYKHGTVFVTYSGGAPTIDYESDGAVSSPSDVAAERVGTYGSTQVNRIGRYMKIMGAPGTIHVRGNSSNPTTIYMIEQVSDEYLYLTDREGKIPSAQHPIPMYGVQLYDKIGSYWKDGSAFNLTEGYVDEKTSQTIYQGKGISLLRAVAKVEVLVPKSLGVPRHVSMRSSNRYVRCEPMDVQTPTDLLWKDHDNGCEWKLIQQQGTFYGLSGTAAYRNKLAWYWGSWLDWGWDFYGGSGGYTIPNGTSSSFPHIMNPFIQRSDFCAFIDVTDFYNDQFYHFVYYMGENTLDAPTNHTGATSTNNSGIVYPRPMVPSVEIRFDNNYPCKLTANNDMNLEDDDCYRFYFTEGGYSGARLTNDPDGTNYEKSDAVKNHWPIIRNHYYRFVVRDDGYSGGGLLVVDAYQREPKIEFN